MFISLPAIAMILAATAPAGGQPPQARAACAPGNPAPSLRFAAEAPETARKSLSWASGIQPDLLRIVTSDRADGACATNIKAFVMDNVFMTDGAAFGREASDGRLVARPGVSMADRTITADKPHPSAGKARFIMAYRVGYHRGAKGLRTDYVGLWRVGAGSLVQGFSALPDGSFTAVRPVLQSRLPLRSVTYFPAPDTASGRLGLVQDDARVTRLIGIDWSHPGFFTGA